MKRLAGILTSVVLVLFLYGCSVDIDGINDRLEALEARVQALEELCAQINTNVSSLQAIVDASQNGDYITSVVPVTEGDRTVGYTISFAKGEPITIYHGQDGDDSMPGYAPEISAAQGDDGVYYWTLDGEWLLDAAGRKIPVQGADGSDGEAGDDGVTPRLKIEGGMWYVSYDGGTTWTQLSDTEDDEGFIGSDSIFEEVTQDDSYVYFVLRGGGTITIPKAGELNLLFDEPSDIKCSPGESVRVAYRVIGGDSHTVVECFDNNGYSAEIVPVDAASGFVEVSVPDPVVSGKVLVYAYNAAGRTVMKTLVFEEGIFEKISDTYKVGGNAECINVEIKTNLDYTMTVTAEAQGWIYVGPATKSDVRTDILRISVAEYPDGPDREATISLIYRDKIVQSIRVIQSSIANTPIQFADNMVKYVLLEAHAVNLDGDNEITFYEAAQCEQLPSFEGSDIKSFNELQYFTAIKSVGNAFSRCGVLRDIVLPSGLTVISDGAFKDCGSLTEIIIPATVEYIGNSAFESCTSLKKVTIPTGVTSIGDAAFIFCLALTEIDIPSSVKVIGEQAFAGSGLTEVELPVGVETIKRAAFQECHSLTRFIFPMGVTSVESDMFAACYALQEVIIPESVTSIGSDAFSSCTTLHKISLPEGMKSIGVGAFYYCLGLTEINIPEGITSIEASTFARCEGLFKLTLPSGVTSIGERAFEWCLKLKDFSIPENVRYIGPYAFAECRALSSVDIPAGVTSLEEGVFSGSGIVSIEIPSTVQSIGDGAFEGSSLKEITIRDGVVSIGKMAFSACPNLKEVVVPNTVETIGDMAFLESIELTSVVLPEGLKMIGNNVFESCVNLSGLTIPKDVESIGNYAFRACMGLTDIEIPSKVTKIGYCAFMECSSLTDIVIPAGVEEMGVHVFRYCSKLVGATFLPLVPPLVSDIGNSLFQDCSALEYISVPLESVDAYKELFFDFMDIITGESVTSN